MIMKFVNSSVIPYCLLFCLGISYFHIENLLSNDSYNSKSYDVTVKFLSDEMQKAIMRREQYIHESRVVGYPHKKSMDEEYLAISNFYASIKQEDTDNGFVKLKSVSNYLNIRIHKDNSSGYEVGIDNVDLDILYSELLSRYGYRGCGPFQRYSVRSEYRKAHLGYITKLVTPLHHSRFKLIYQDTAYQLHRNKLQLLLSQEDIERGYANIVIRDRVTLEEMPYKLEISTYAFKA